MVKSRNGLTGDYVSPEAIKKQNDLLWGRKTENGIDSSRMMIKVLREDFILNPEREETIVEDKSAITYKELRLAGLDFNKGRGWRKITVHLNWKEEEQYNGIEKDLKDSVYIKKEEKIEWFKKLYDTELFRSDSHPEYADMEKFRNFMKELDEFVKSKETEGIKYNHFETTVTIPSQYIRAGVNGWIESEIYNNAIIKEIKRDVLPSISDSRTYNSENEMILIDRTPEEQRVQLVLSITTKEQLNNVKSEVYRYFAIPDFVNIIMPDVWTQYNYNNPELDDSKWIVYEQLAFTEMTVDETDRDRDKIYDVTINFESRTKNKVEERFSYTDKKELELTKDKKHYKGITNKNKNSDTDNKFLAAIRVTKRDLYKISFGTSNDMNTGIPYNYPWYDKDVDEYILIFDTEDDTVFKIEVKDAKVALQSYIYYKENGKDTNIDNTIEDVSKYTELYNKYIYNDNLRYELSGNNNFYMTVPLPLSDGTTFAMRERGTIW